jgi:hypothetical protein
MENCHVRYVVHTWIVSAQLMKARSATLIFIYIGCPGIISLGNGRMYSRWTILSQRGRRSLSHPKIVDMLDKLTSDPERLGYFEGYGQMQNWTHKCGSWELPYILALILMHNIDVMHQERNKGKSTVSTCLGLPGKTKDNTKDRKNLTELCNCPTLELTEPSGKPCDLFCLKPEQRKEVI